MEFSLQWEPAFYEENVLILSWSYEQCQVVIKYLLNNFHKVILQAWRSQRP